GLEGLDEDVRLHAARVAEEPRDAARPIATVVRGDLADIGAPDHVGARIAEVRDRGFASADGRRDERRRGPRETLVLRGVEHRGIRLLHRVAERDPPGVAEPGRHESLREALDRRGARHVAAGLAADPVGHRDERHPGVLAGEPAILVAVTDEAGVGPGREVSHSSWCSPYPSRRTTG